MFGQSNSEPLTLTQRGLKLFQLTSAGSKWLFAADWIDEEGDPFVANAFRAGIYQPATNGDGDGYGYGNGDGYGDGYGYGNGDGDGNGYGDGYGYGNGDGYGDGDGDGNGDGDGYGDG